MNVLIFEPCCFCGVTCLDKREGMLGKAFVDYACLFLIVNNTATGATQPPLSVSFESFQENFPVPPGQGLHRDVIVERRPK